MKLYWTQKSIPELRGLDKKDQGAAWKFAHEKCFGHWQIYAGLAIIACCGGLGVYFGDFSRSVVSGSLGAGIGGGIGGFIYSQILIALARRYLLEWRELNLKRSESKTGANMAADSTASRRESP